MPALLVDTSPRPVSASAAVPSDDHAPGCRAPASPDRPPVSPITPTASHAELAKVERHVEPPKPQPKATFRSQPPSVPISESENPDAIALRSAISLLQLQREKSKRDLRALAELKSSAVTDPKAFAQSLQDQRSRASRSPHDVLAPTLSDLSSPDAVDATDKGEEQDRRKDSGATETNVAASRLPDIPQPQSIVRCPPVNWAKYHIVGEPLDKLHAEQKKWPGHAEPPRTQSGARAPAHAVAAPYSPFTDGISKPSTHSAPSRGTKKSPS